MDVASAVSGYISKMVGGADSTTTSSSGKMKILLLDSETVSLEAWLEYDSSNIGIRLQ